jgi:hypothetical protein
MKKLKPVLFADNRGRTALHWACRLHAPIEVLEELIAHFAPLLTASLNDHRDGMKRTLVYHAVQCNAAPEVLSLLLRFGIDPHAPCCMGFTPLMMGAKRGSSSALLCRLVNANLNDLSMQEINVALDYAKGSDRFWSVEEKRRVLMLLDGGVQLQVFFGFRHIIAPPPAPTRRADELHRVLDFVACAFVGGVIRNRVFDMLVGFSRYGTT